MFKSRRVLVTPLNWGLGHVSRCIPIIDAFLAKGATVLLASDGRALSLLREEYPKLKSFELSAYNVEYRGENMIWTIGRQLPKISRAIYAERKKIKEIVLSEKIDTIISDNRYGCRNKLCKNIFITHQVSIPIPNHQLKIITNKINHYFINRFDECWIPDFSGDNNLSGELSKGNIPARFIGPLSRFQNKPYPKEYDLIAVLSGPEPQRSILEEKIIQQLKATKLKTLIVQGKTESLQVTPLNDRIKMVSFMTSKELNEAILKSEIVLARSGYSTIMDLAALHKKAILIPTPGQTEQEYLAKRLHQKGIFYTQTQSAFNLNAAMDQVQNYSGFEQDYVLPNFDFL